MYPRLAVPSRLESPATVSLIRARFSFRLGTVNSGLHFLRFTGAIGFYASLTERRDEERDVVAEDQGSISKSESQ